MDQFLILVIPEQNPKSVVFLWNYSRVNDISSCLLIIASIQYSFPALAFLNTVLPLTCILQPLLAVVSITKQVAWGSMTLRLSPDQSVTISASCHAFIFHYCRLGFDQMTGAWSQVCELSKHRVTGKSCGEAVVKSNPEWTFSLIWHQMVALLYIH